MQQAVSARTPVHVWIVGILSLLWRGCVGCYDYVDDAGHAQHRLPRQDEDAEGRSNNAMLAWVDSFPRCMHRSAGRGGRLGRALLGSILLLVRSRYAVWGLRRVAWSAACVSLGWQMFTIANAGEHDARA